MARSTFLVLFAVAILLSNSFSQGYGRRVKVLRHPPEKSLLEEFPVLGRIMQEITEMDYKEPGPNTNPRSGQLTIPPPSPPAPPKH